MTKQLDGNVAVITGAGRGIGRAIASGFAEQGAKIVCAARTSAQINDTVHAIRNAGGDAIAVPCDVGDAAAVERLYAETRAHFGPVDIVLANAGGNFSRATVEAGDIADWERTLRVNLLGVYYSCKFAIPDLKGKGGHIIVVGSGVGHRVVDTAHSAYGASKAGAWMFVRALAAELRPYNICVNELIPGLVQTDITAEVNRSDDSAFGAEWFKQPEDVLPLALFLATQPLTGPSGQSFSLMRRDSQ
ncbi:MAG: SDR family NAD(P)-dependent oxidoreductase [Chloroflexi bacterium]|nr:SDR family NAD(P)-dependent oxidoreductase [Chloroflexota bacterium]